MKMSKTCPADVCLYQILVNNWRYNLSNSIVEYVGKPYAARDLGDFLVEYDKNKTT